jgi:beta-glucosidase
MLRFPDAFVWGVATSAFQIEGASDADGKSPSIWDTFVNTPGTIADGSTADRSADSYHRMEDDLACLSQLGVGAYRLSFSWPRIIPQGHGRLNPAGLDYYHRLIDALLQRGITPYVTLYHWDLPQVLQDRGGWENRETAAHFSDYAAAMVLHFGDKVRHWITFNEINPLVAQGYGSDQKAPGLQLEPKALMQVYHHLFLAHGLAVKAMRCANPNIRIGIAEAPMAPVPLIEDEAHIHAANLAWNDAIGLVLDPLLLGSYPQGLAHYPTMQQDDMALIAAPLDFVGINVYTGNYVEPSQKPPFYRTIPFTNHFAASPAEPWLRIVPESMYWAIRLCHEHYGPRSIYIMENGCALPTAPSLQREIEDSGRIMYLRAYLASLHRALGEGYAVDGYFLWTLMDCFEWKSGLGSRFGLYHTDFKSLVRTPRKSALWYREVICHNSVA